MVSTPAPSSIHSTRPPTMASIAAASSDSPRPLQGGRWETVGDLPGLARPAASGHEGCPMRTRVGFALKKPGVQPDDTEPAGVTFLAERRLNDVRQRFWRASRRGARVGAAPSSWVPTRCGIPPCAAHGSRLASPERSRPVSAHGGSDWGGPGSRETH